MIAPPKAPAAARPTGTAINAAATTASHGSARPAKNSDRCSTSREKGSRRSRSTLIREPWIERNTGANSSSPIINSSRMRRATVRGIGLAWAALK